MPASSNPVYLNVRPEPALAGVGWEVRVLSHEDYATTIAVIGEYVQLTIAPEVNAPGAGSITFDADSPMWAQALPGGQPASTLLDHEHVWEAYEDGELRFQWLGTNVVERADEDETRTVTVSGPGGGQVLEWAKVFPPGFPTPSAPFWTFNTNIMAAYLTLLTAAQERGTITWVTPTFTAAADSGGVAWADADVTAEWKPDLGADLLTVLGTATGQDLDKPANIRADWVMWPGWQLDVRPEIGAHREQSVIFFEGGIHDKERTRTREKIANLVAVRDVHGQLSIATDTASIGRFGQREQLRQQANITDSERRDQVAQVVLEQGRDELSSWTITVPYASPGRRVFVDYGLGDWIGVARHTPGAPSIVEAYRVLAIAVRVTGDGEPTLQLTLQTVLDARQRQLALRLTNIVNNVGGGLADLPDVNIPGLPDYSGPVVWNPDTGRFEIGSFPAGLGGGFGGGIKMFIQTDDPGDAANIGDLWLFKTW